MRPGVQILYIKNMVCPRCRSKVMQIFKSTGCQRFAVQYGQVVIKSQPVPSKQQIQKQLKEHGFELLISDEERLAEQVKTSLICLLYHNRKITLPGSISWHLEMKIHKRFEELNDLFYSVTQHTIQKYFDLLRFERAKELVSYQQQSLGKIAIHLGYKKKDNLVKKFEKILNVSISEFRKNPSYYRLPLDQLIVN